ncbi:MAG: alpha/beta fold hydrolase, partial [Actinomycetota bacterium]|nr:alpha/beta fold hydrolase [Actinomycetota bacterium]
AAQPATSAPAPRPAPAPADGALELIGYLLASETVQHLSAIDLSAATGWQRAPGRVLALGRDGMRVDPRLVRALEEAGSAVTVAEGAGYGELTTDPQQSRPPRETIARTISWLAEQAQGESSEDALGTVPATRPQVERDHLQLRQDGVLLRETPLQLLCGARRLFAISTEPAGGGREDICAVFLNAGAQRHIGPNRNWVETARRWAARGVCTVRVDLQSIGDSEGEDTERLTEVNLYERDRVEQALAVLEQLRAAQPGRRFVLVGLCSGAYWALHAAMTDSSVAAALLINLYAFTWSATLVAERDRRAAARALRGGFAERLRSGGFRRELLIRGIRSFKPGRAHLLARRNERAQAPQVATTLDHLRDQDTQILFLLGKREPLYGQLEHQGHLSHLDRWPNVTVERIPLQDHIFRALWSQRFVHERLDAALDRLLAQRPVAPAGVPQGDLPRPAGILPAL